jgi:galactokinase
MTQRDSPADLKQSLERFRELHGDGEIAVLHAPARINILGEHVDYVSYLPTASLPFGSAEHGMRMLFRANEDGAIRGASLKDAFPPFEFSIADESFSDESWETQIFSRPAPAPHWSNYARGAVSFARWKHGAALDRGFSFLIDSTIPANSGASSSSALVVLAGAAVRQVNGIAYRPEELARESAQAEWYLGTRGGALDHMAICLARRGHAVHLLHAKQETHLVPVPSDGYRWITFFSHPAAKGGEVMLAYNERAAVSRILIPALLDDLRQHSSWFGEDWDQAMSKLAADTAMGCDELESLLGEMPDAITLDEFARQCPAAFRDCESAFPALVAAGDDRPLNLLDRSLHHLGEIARVAAALDWLRDSRADRAMRGLGELINDCHDSLRSLYDVCTPEVDALVDILRRDPQVYGSRLMGGGFGGNVLALTAAEYAPSLVNRVQEEFYAPRGRDARGEGSVMISTPGDGLSSVEYGGSPPL